MSDDHLPASGDDPSLPPAATDTWPTGQGRHPVLDALHSGGGEAWGPMIATLRDLLDRVAAIKADDATVAALHADLAAWSRRLAPYVVAERHQIFGRRRDLPGRGQSMMPVIAYRETSERSLRADVTFGRYFLGAIGAAHGGAVALVFDETMGRLTNIGRSIARTAYLHTDFRAIAPIETVLDLHVWWVSQEGRKRLVRAELRNGETLCAEAEGLFVELNPGQP